MGTIGELLGMAGIIMIYYHIAMAALVLVFGKRFLFSRFGQNVAAMGIVFRTRDTFAAARSTGRFILRHIKRCGLGVLLMLLGAFLTSL